MSGQEPSRSSSRVPSVDPSSTTISPRLATGSSAERASSIAASSVARSLNTGIRTEMSGIEAVPSDGDFSPTLGNPARGCKRLPAGKRKRQHGRAARCAVDLERAAEHAHALADADEAETAALCRSSQGPLDLEARAVVADTHLDRATAGSHEYVDAARPAVLAHVRERLLDRPEDGHALRRAERFGVAANLEVDRDP